MMGSIAYWSPEPNGALDIDQDSGLAQVGTTLPRVGTAEGQLYAVNPWDLVIFRAASDVFLLPGLCDVRGAVELGIDKKSKPGADGSKMTVTGYRPRPFEIDCTVWTSEQWDVLVDIVDQFWCRPKKRTKVSRIAFGVDHPALHFVKVTRAAIEGIVMPVDGKIPDSKVVKFRMLESVDPGADDATKAIAPLAFSVVPELRKDAPKNALPPPPSRTLTVNGAEVEPLGGVE